MEKKQLDILSEIYEVDKEWNLTNNLKPYKDLFRKMFIDWSYCLDMSPGINAEDRSNSLEITKIEQKEYLAKKKIYEKAIETHNAYVIANALAENSKSSAFLAKVWIGLWLLWVFATIVFWIIPYRDNILEALKIIFN